MENLGLEGAQGGEGKGDCGSAGRQLIEEVTAPESN